MADRQRYPSLKNYNLGDGPGRPFPSSPAAFPHLTHHSSHCKPSLIALWNFPREIVIKIDCPWPLCLLSRIPYHADSPSPHPFFNITLTPITAALLLYFSLSLHIPFAPWYHLSRPLSQVTNQHRSIKPTRSRKIIICMLDAAHDEQSFLGSRLTMIKTSGAQRDQDWAPGVQHAKSPSTWSPHASATIKNNTHKYYLAHKEY